MAAAKASDTRFVANPMLEYELARSTMLADDLKDIADEVLQRAQDNAPVDEGFFKEDMRVETGVDGGVITARFIADNWKAVIIEYGTASHPFSSPIRRGIEAMGLKLEYR